MKTENNLSKRAARLLNAAHYSAETNPAIAALVAFACQNSGLDFANYGERRSYQSEARSITADFARFKAALTEASLEGVTDAEVIAEAPHAFSGRLEPVAACRLWGNKEWHPVRGVSAQGYEIGPKDRPPATIAEKQLTIAWKYCTGQYFPTEYRKAAATLLEYATRRARQARPPKKSLPRTISELKELNKANGGCWFDRSNMRFFNSKIESGVIAEKYFVTSERYDDNAPREYTVRSFDEEGSVDTVGEFQGYASKAEACAAIRAL